MSEGKLKLTEWMKSVPKSELNPTDALARFIREKCKGKISVDLLQSRLPNVASFVRAVFSEKRRRGEKRGKKVKADAV